MGLVPNEIQFPCRTPADTRQPLHRFLAANPIPVPWGSPLWEWAHPSPSGLEGALPHLPHHRRFSPRRSASVLSTSGRTVRLGHVCHVSWGFPVSFNWMANVAVLRGSGVPSGIHRVALSAPPQRRVVTL